MEFFNFFFKYFIVPRGKFVSLSLGKAQQPQEQRYTFLFHVCSIFVCSSNGMAAYAWDF